MARPKPLIGMTTSELHPKDRVRPTREGDPAQLELALGIDYVRAVEAAGGLPVVLPPGLPSAVAPLLDRLDGLCLSGGPDLDPASYGGGSHPELGPTEPAVDRFEIGLARMAWRRGLPLLTICRGMQALNVARGGTLIQHLPELVGDEIVHRQQEPAAQVTHSISLEPGSLLAQLIGTDDTEVNSFHHQAVDKLGDGLRITARAPDGVVEGIESTGRSFAIGVQWHAECLAGRAEQASLFDALVSNAREYARRDELGQQAA